MLTTNKYIKTPKLKLSHDYHTWDPPTIQQHNFTVYLIHVFIYHISRCYDDLI